MVNPQRWNKYAYVINNPLALDDPTGQEDHGNGGGKIIDVFINMTSKDRSGRKGPDWDQIKSDAKKRGYDVNIHPKDSITLSDISNSLKNAEVTLIVGHSEGLWEGPRIGNSQRRQFQATDIDVKDGWITANGLERKPIESNGVNMPLPKQMLGQVENSTKVTGLFTCNAVPLFTGFKQTGQNQVLFANNGGQDGETSLITLERSAAAFVQQYVRTEDVDSSIDAAQDIIDNSTFSDLSGRNGLGPYTDKDGDRLVRSPQ